MRDEKLPVEYNGHHLGDGHTKSPDFIVIHVYITHVTCSYVIHVTQFNLYPLNLFKKKQWTTTKTKTVPPVCLSVSPEEVVWVLDIERFFFSPYHKE